MKAKAVFAVGVFFLAVACNLCLAQKPTLVLPIGHTDFISCASFSPDGKYIVTASRDGIVKVWNSLNGKLLVNNLKGHTANITCATFSPDSRFIVTASDDNTAKVWDILSGELIANLNKHTEKVNCAYFSPDGKFIVTASVDKTAKIWNAVSGALIANLNKHTESVNNACFSPDGKYIVTSSGDMTAKVWKTINGMLTATLKGHTGAVINASFSPACTDDPTGGKYIVTVSADKTANVWNVASGQLTANLKGHKNRVNCLSFSTDGKYVVTGSEDKTAKVWNLTTGQLTVTMKGDKESNDDLFYSPGEQNFVAKSEKKVNSIWEGGYSQLSKTLEGHTDEVISAFFSPDGKYILTSSLDDTTRVWDAASGILVFAREGKAATFSPKGKYFVTVLNDYTARIWNSISGKQTGIMSGHTNQVSTAFFSSDGKYFITQAEDNSVRLWNLSTGQLILNLKNSKAVFSGNSKSMATITAGGICRIWNVPDGLLTTTLKKHNKEISSVSFSPRCPEDPIGGKYIVTVSADSLVRVWHTLTGQLIVNLEDHLDQVIGAAFSPDGKYIVTSSGTKTARIWNILNGQLKATITNPSGSINSASFSPISLEDPMGGKFLATTSFLDDSIKIWNTVSGLLFGSLKGREVSFSPDGKQILTSSFDGKTRVWDSKSHTTINLSGSSAFFSPDGKFVYTITYDGSGITNELVYNEEKQYNEVLVKQWDAASGKLKNIRKFKEGYIGGINFTNYNIINLNNSEINFFTFENGNKLYSLIALDSNDYVEQLPSGYYQSTPNAAKLLHYVTKDLKVISFEQLDVKYNRPDLVLEAIGNTDTSLINAYRYAYYKRIKKLGIDTTSFREGYSVPEADFADRDNIPPEQSTEYLTLHLKGADSTYALDRYNVWVNEVPIYGQRGINIRAANSKSFDKTISIPLSAGENRIETSITNVNGTESYRMPLTATYTPTVTPKETTYFIGIGIDHFADASNNLKYCSKDIRDLSASLKKKFGDNITIDTLFNESVTVSNILALKKKLLQSTVNDKVIISYSGHGLLSKDKDYFLSTYNINFSNPDENGLPYSDLESLLDSIPARKKLLLIDACHSGEIDKEEIQSVTTNKAALDSNHVVTGKKAFGNIVTNTAGAKKLGSKSSIELVQSLFVNVGKSTGATIIAAAAGTEFALENGDLKNGVFTYSIMEAMTKYPTMKITELKKRVGARVEELTKGMQKPTSRNEAIAVDWKLW